MADPRKAQLQLGNYRITKELGRGGFALVFLGEHIFLQRPAAIKVLRLDPRLLRSSDLEDFLIEAQTVARLEHDHIVRILEFGVDGKINMPFLVMDYAPNGTLATRHPEGTCLDLSTIISYVKQVASALQYAHDKGVIHRDVKPENMLLKRSNEVVLSDFGIAVAVQNMTKTGEVMGTIYYMAPEQFRGKSHPASDQYALGVAVYKWLCGRFPFEGSNPIELCRLHTEVDPPPLRRMVPEIPGDVEHVVRTALAKDPRQRFKSVEAFANALEVATQSKRQPPAPPVHPVEDESLPPRYPSISSLLPTIRAKPGPRPEGLSPLEEPTVVATPLPAAPRPPIEDPVDESTILSALLPLARPRALVVAFSDAGSDKRTYQGHSAWVSAVAWSPGGQYIASGSWDNTVQIWNSATGHTKLTYTGHTHTVKAVAWSPDGTYIASGSWDNTVHVWHAATGDDLPGYYTHSAQVEAVAWSPDGISIASAGHDCTVQVWKAANRATIFIYRGHTAPIWSVAWSPDGRYIASASHDHTIQVWNAMTGEHILTYQGHTAQVSTVAWSPDKQHIASASLDGVVQLWHISTGKTLLSYGDDAGAVKALGWSPDGRSIASAVKTVQVWDTKAPTPRTPIFTYHGHSSWINALAWSPDGRWIASASDDQTVQIWQPV